MSELPIAPAAPPLALVPATVSLIYPGWDWADASPIEMTIEAEYLAALIGAYPQETAKEELARLTEAARQKGVKLK